MYRCFGYLYVCAIHVWLVHAEAGKEGVRSLGTEITGSCELLCGCWKLNLGPLEEQPVILTDKLSLQPQETIS